MQTVEALPDYYAVLGVPRHTSSEGIRQAYLQRAWQYHPDLHPDDAETDEQMSAVNVAYATLSDPTRRAAYDVGRIHIRLEPPRSSTGTFRPSVTRYRGRVRHEPSVVGTAWEILVRLARCVTATLPS